MVEKQQPSDNSSNSNPIPGCSLSACIQDDNMLVCLAGEVDLGSAPKIYAQLWHASERGQRPIILNLERVSFMDSSGLQILLRLREKLQQQCNEVLLVKPQPQIERLFKLTGFDKLFAFFTDNDQAKSFLKFHQQQPDLKENDKD